MDETDEVHNTICNNRRNIENTLTGIRVEVGEIRE